MFYRSSFSSCYVMLKDSWKEHTEAVVGESGKQKVSEKVSIGFKPTLEKNN